MTIDQFNFAGKKAFVRVDFNVPLDENFNITDDTRMRAALPTLKKILADGGSVIIGSHLGRPKGPADKFSLKHILKHLEELLGVEVQFANDCMGEEAAVKAAALQPGEVLLLENLRFYAEEEGKPRGLAEDATDEEKKAAKAAVKESQKEFTKKLASYADCYVNDAFGTAHRAHASTALIAKYFDKDNKMFGYLMEKEVKAVDKVLNDIQRPFTAIMGGSKVSSKIEIIENLLNKVDNLIIAGGMTYTFTKAMGGKIGISICEDDKLDLALDLVKKAKEKGVPIISSMGAGNKLDPTMFRVADIYKTKVCPLAKVMRRELKKRGVKKLKVVYSEEQPVRPINDMAISCRNHCICPPGAAHKCTERRDIPGSTAFVPSVVGLIIAGEVIKDLTRDVMVKSEQ